jgi:hypothetical protein
MTEGEREHFCLVLSKRQVSDVGRKLEWGFPGCILLQVGQKKLTATHVHRKIFSPQLFLMANATMAHMMDG